MKSSSQDIKMLDFFPFHSNQDIFLWLEYITQKVLFTFIQIFEQYPSSVCEYQILQLSFLLLQLYNNLLSSQNKLLYDSYLSIMRLPLSVFPSQRLLSVMIIIHCLLLLSLLFFLSMLYTLIFVSSYPSSILSTINTESSSYFHHEFIGSIP